MEQDMQSNENDMEIKLDSEGEPINPKPEKKINKKVILLVLVILAIIGAGAVYFLFLNKEDDGKLPIEENTEVLEDKKEAKIDKELDTDQDGLPDYMEKILGTDVNSADTDGDTYSDFDEIKNGYDPLGDKKFTEEEWENLKEKIRSENELYNDMFVVEEKKTINFSQFIEICEDIENESLRSSCINPACDLLVSKEEKIKNCLSNDVNVYRNMCFMMIKPLTVEVCDKLSDNLYKDDCYSEVVGQTKDILICEKISDDIGSKVNCYKNLALSENDPEICQKIDYNYFKEWCATDSIKDFLICRKIKDGNWNEVKFDDWKNVCFGAVTGGIDYCEKINDESLRYSCYKDVAVKRNYLLICDEIKSDYDKDECYMRIAVKREDNTLCDLLGDKFREQCHNQISIKKADFSFCKELSETEQILCYYPSMLRALDYFDIIQDEEGLSFCKAVEYEIINRN